MFIQKCFIRKNTPELVKRLEWLGYEIPFVVEYGNGDTILAKYGLLCNIHSIPNSIFGENYFSLLTHSAIDCGTNEELFLAIASLRDDSDRFQWFTNGKEWIQCEKEDWIDEISSLCVGGKYNYDKNGELSVDFHKATVEELIEHFTV